MSGPRLGADAPARHQRPYQAAVPPVVARIRELDGSGVARVAIDLEIGRLLDEALALTPSRPAGAPPISGLPRADPGRTFTPRRCGVALLHDDDGAQRAPERHARRAADRVVLPRGRHDGHAVPRADRDDRHRFALIRRCGSPSPWRTRRGIAHQCYHWNH